MNDPEWRVGDIVRDECISCGAENLWAIEGITQEKYIDGMDKCYHLKAVKNCICVTVRTSVRASYTHGLLREAQQEAVPPKVETDSN